MNIVLLILYILCMIYVFTKMCSLYNEVEKLQEENLNLQLELAKYDPDTLNNIFDEEE